MTHFSRFLGKTRESMFKQSIRIQNPNIDPKDELEKMKEVFFILDRDVLTLKYFLVQNE